MIKLQEKKRSDDTFRPGVKVAVQDTASITMTKPARTCEARPENSRAAQETAPRPRTPREVVSCDLSAVPAVPQRGSQPPGPHPPS